ncbi:MAG: hypothetical protein U9R08_03860 [Nanoarchaeota archaeon]|nr:hypothetical protein [Nanoarchaeota archaeon]
MTKRGSLNLSVNAIVVMVIAFVVMGLALTFTQIIFKGGREKLEEAISVPEFGREATAENPITIPDTVNIQVGKSDKLKFQYYNKMSDSATNVTMAIVSCQNSETGASLNEFVMSGDTPTDKRELPTMVSPIAINVGPSQVYEFKTVLSANKAPAALYICTLVAGSINSGEVFETKTVFLNIAS